jgi:hypothetical protein
LTSAAIAAGLASFITTPLDLIKLRIQISDTNTIRPGLFYSSFRSTLRKEGMKGLFKGATARVETYNLIFKIYFIIFIIIMIIIIKNFCKFQVLYYTPTQALAMAIFEELKSNKF